MRRLLLLSLLLASLVSNLTLGKVQADNERGNSARGRDNGAKSVTPTSSKPGSFPEAVRALKEGVFLVGGEKGHGTAWVISKKHRLLATNAHVADINFKASGVKFQAMMNGTNRVYPITKIWYHPGVRRWPTEDKQLSVRSISHLMGDVNPSSPDVAVLQLGSEGPDLPVELALADPKVVFDLQTLPVGILGYPGTDTLDWPSKGQRALATFHEGVVSRVTDFNLDAVPDELSQCLQYTMDTWGGFSGSPIFLKSGEVVALHNKSRPADPKGGSRNRFIAHGVRVDSLWELLVYHKLDNLVRPPIAPEQLFVKRWHQPDAALALYNKLNKLHAEARELVYDTLDFQGGIDKCNEMIQLFDRFAPAYYTRAMAYNNMYFRNSKSYTFQKNAQLLTKALEDAEKNLNLHYADTVTALRGRITVINNIGNLTGDRKYNYQALDQLDRLLRVPGLTKFEIASALSSKATALANVGKTEDARLTHLKALQTYPDNEMLWENRASHFAANDNMQVARTDRAMAASLRKKTILLNRTRHKDVKIVSTVETRLAADDGVDGRGCYLHAWQVELEAGYFYEITLINPEFRTDKDYDPILRLSDAKGKLIQEDDDGLAYPNARIYFTAPRSEAFRFTVTSYIPRQTGPYVLTVRRIAKDE